jgi:hypothetical protein
MVSGGTRLRQLAADNGIGKSTAYDYLRRHRRARRPRARPAWGHAGGQCRRVRPRHYRRHPDRNRPSVHPRPHREWTCGGPETRQPRRQRPGHRRPGRLATVDLRVRPGREHDTTAYAPTPRSCPPSPWPAPTCVRWVTSATKARPTPHRGIQETPPRQSHHHSPAVQQGPQRRTGHRRTGERPTEDDLPSPT